MTELRLIELAWKQNLISNTTVTKMNSYDNNVLVALTEIHKQVNNELLTEKWLVESKAKAKLLERISELEITNPSEAMSLTHEFLKR